MSKSYTPTRNDLNVLDYLWAQTDVLTVKEIKIGMGGDGLMKDLQYSITKLTKAGYIKTMGVQPQVNADGTRRRGRPSRLIAITEAGIMESGNFFLG